MKILLPPSETKKPGGSGEPLVLESLALHGLRPQREQVLDALARLSRDSVEASRVLKLSPRQQGEILDNLAVRSAPTMPAAERYTGVLYDALGYETMTAGARGWLEEHVWIHTAVLGPISAADPLPAYRLAAGTAVPGIPPLRRLWAEATSAAIEDSEPGFLIDLRSEAYAALGPLPAGSAGVYVRVVSAGEDGVVRALNHFNKKAKGELVRALAEGSAALETPDDLTDWLRDGGFHGWTEKNGSELLLQVPSSSPHQARRSAKR